MSEEIKKAVLTLATGKEVYIKMAISLIRSFNLWHKNSDIKFILATDQKELLPSDIIGTIEIVELNHGELGLGFSPKLYLDKISTAKQTLFVDSDCLCFGPLEPVFEKFDGHAVSVIGKKISNGDFFGNVESICNRFSLRSIPCFVGGVYYFEKSNTSSSIYQTARSLESQYDEIGLLRLRGRPNEEPLMAIAMSMHDQSPILDDGSVKAEPMFYPSGIRVDVLRGRAILWNSPDTSSYCSTWNLTQAQPAIVHFHCSNAERAPYTRECLKLKKVFKDNWNPWAASIYAFVKMSIPQMIKGSFKDFLRPLYRRFFGVRAVKKSIRIVDS